MNMDLIMQVAQELGVDPERVKKAYEEWEDSLNPFMIAVESSQLITAEDLKTRVGGPEC